MSSAKRRIFISYARGDREFAIRLTNDLRAAGIDTWRDEASIRAGEKWDEAVENGIRACPEFLIILSPRSVRSKNVERELDCALHDKSKPILPALRRTCEVPFEIRRRQMIDFRGSYPTGFAQLLEQAPPALAWWQRAWMYLNRAPWVPPVAAALGVLLLVAALSYLTSPPPPSRTTLDVTDSTPDAIVVHVRNDGGQPSRLVGGSHWLRFGGFGIEDQQLALTDPARMSLVPAHGVTTVRLTAAGLTPLAKPEGGCFAKAELATLFRKNPIMLVSSVAESEGERRYSVPVPIGKIQTFVERRYPDVTGRCHVQ